MSYRDDLEAAQARAKALEREVADLKRRNAELEDELQRVWEQKPDPAEENPDPVALQVPAERRIVYPTGLAAISVPVMMLGFGAVVLAMVGGLIWLAAIGVAAMVGGAYLGRA